MVDWLRTEFGGVVITLMGYAARALVDASVPTWQMVTARVVLAIICGILAQVVMPSAVPDWTKAAVLVLVGLCTKELVQLYMKIGLQRIEKDTEK